MSKMFDLIDKALEYNGEWYYLSCGESRAWYMTQDGKMLEIPRDSGMGYDAFMCSDDNSGDLNLAISRLDSMVDDAREKGVLQ